MSSLHNNPDVDPQSEARNLNIRIVCKHCRNPRPNIIDDYTSGDMICGDCGLVLGDHLIDTRPEWRTFADSECPDPSRVGDIESFHFGNQDQLSSTTISTSASKKTNSSISLIQTHSKTTETKADAKLLGAYKTISMLAEKLGMTKASIDAAKHVYLKLSEKKMPRSKRGKFNELLIAVSLYTGCRSQNVPRSYEEIGKVTGVGKQSIGKLYRDFVTPMLVELENGIGVSTVDRGWESQLARVCSDLELKQEVEVVARQILQKTHALGLLDGRTTKTILGVGVYLASCLSRLNCLIPAHKIAKTLDCQLATIKKAYSIVYPEREKLVQGIANIKSVSSLPGV
ncbi:transcription initiation factor IIB [Blyttiomyces sp. JEL0837]|nr:transcription initiation factor IIB [Blyttiomyces sp. JEL0837]